MRMTVHCIAAGASTTSVRAIAAVRLMDKAAVSEANRVWARFVSRPAATVLLGVWPHREVPAAALSSGRAAPLTDAHRVVAAELPRQVSATRGGCRPGASHRSERARRADHQDTPLGARTGFSPKDRPTMAAALPRCWRPQRCLPGALRLGQSICRLVLRGPRTASDMSSGRHGAFRALARRSVPPQPCCSSLSSWPPNSTG